MIFNPTGGSGGIRLDSITITTPPAKTAYISGETFDGTGMVVRAHYSNGAEQDVGGYTVEPQVLTDGVAAVTVRYSEGGRTATAEQAVTVTKRSLEIPAQSGTLTYDGTEQAPSFTNDPGEFAVQSGDTAATNAGGYTAVFTLNQPEYCEWADGSTEDKRVPWSIGKAAASLTLSAESVTLSADRLTAEVTAATDSDGEITAESSDTTVATVSVSGTTVTVNSVNGASGTATVTVKVAEGTNYTAYTGTGCAVQVNARFWADFVDGATGDEAWWAGLYNACVAGNVSQDWVGREVNVTLSEAVLGTTTHKVRCIGVNQDGNNTVTFQTSNCLANTTEFGSSAVWIGSTARAKCKEYGAAFPGKDYVKTVQKGTCPNASTNRTGSPTYNDEDYWLPSGREIDVNSYTPLSTSNSTTSKAECTQGYNEAYSYYNSKNRRIKKNGDSGSACKYWERSRYYSSKASSYLNYVCIVSSGGDDANDDGYASIGTYNSSSGLAPAFVIGP